jgi:FkbM family methyltransferase
MRLLPSDIYNLSDGFERRLALLHGDAITYMLQKDGFYERHLSLILQRILRPGDVCVDMGANLGYHSLLMSRLVENIGSVHAFEPQRITFQQLNCNVFLNRLDNVWTYHSAVGDREGFVNIEMVDYYRTVEGYYGTNIGNTSINFSDVGDVVRLTTLDSLGLKRCNFLKIDVQGSEVLALRGAATVIRECRPVIFIEIEDPHLSKFGFSAKDVLGALTDFGYDVFQICNEYPCDHLCLPKGQSFDFSEFPFPVVKRQA